MQIKTKGLVALVIGALLVGLGLVYGVSGALVPSISERGANITRWEAQLVKDKQALATLIADVERLGKKQGATPDEHKQYEYKVESMEQRSEHLRAHADLLAEERSSRKQMMITTAVFAILGVLAMFVGLRLRARR